MKREAIDAEKIFHPKKYPMLAKMPPVLIGVFSAAESDRARYNFGRGAVLVNLHHLRPHEAESRFNVAVAHLVGEHIAQNLHPSPVVHIMPADKREKNAKPFEVINLRYNIAKIGSHAAISIDSRNRARVMKKVRTARAAGKGISRITTEREHMYVEILRTYKDAIARELWKIAKQYGTAN